MGASVARGFVPGVEFFVGGVQWLVRKPFLRAFPWYKGRFLCVGSRACCASVGWVTNGSLEGPFQGLSNCARGCGWALPPCVLGRVMCAGCALGEWATNGSLESSFQGLSNGARGGVCGWLVLVPWPVECGLGVTRAVGLCLDAL
eukprot:scaffold15055_cov121-Isochrysis_galbana.AAC.3